MERPCYLQGGPGFRVALDGPALSVARPGKARTLYPLRRISRVVASGEVEWSTRALLACAERGITVTFLTRDGALRGCLVGQGGERQELLARLRDLLDRPDWRERYEDWRRGMASRARLALGRRLGLAPGAVTLGELVVGLRGELVARAGSGVAGFLERRLTGLTRALVLEQLSRAGLDARQLQALAGRVDLVGDLAGLVVLDLLLPLLRWLEGREAGGRITDREVVELFEGRGERLEGLVRTLIARLHGWLAEV